MIRVNCLKLDIDYSEKELHDAIIKRLRIGESELISFQIIKQSLDARKKSDIHYTVSVDVKVKNEKFILKNKKIKDIAISDTVIYNEPLFDFSFDAPIIRPVIVGLGPAGLICAYKLAKAGLKPIVIERGADVDTRLADVEAFWNGTELKPNSNVQFGEGGAGTFSDGKLNSMIHDTFGRIGEVFRIFIEHGADPSIAYVNKPHIGTDKLRGIIKNIRNEIISLGGEVRFNSCLTDIVVNNGQVSAIEINKKELLPCSTLVLAIGHSARDTFYKIAERNIPMERKAFAVGVRIQHPQAVINADRYGSEYNQLPAADYKLTYKASNGRGVYSFCMCPGGFVVNASSEPGRLVVNGMSNSDRSERTANSALVVTVREDDFPGVGVLAGVELQRTLEEKCFIEGQGLIPVQYLCDFLSNKITESIIENAPNSKGGWVCGNLNNILPMYVSESLKEAMPAFGNTIKGYNDDHALLLGLESRTSSPVRILRGDNLESLTVQGLYPCGEGAGYAGGITSAAVDGLKVYEAIVNKLSQMSKG